MLILTIHEMRTMFMAKWMNIAHKCKAKDVYNSIFTTEAFWNTLGILYFSRDYIYDPLH